MKLQLSQGLLTVIPNTTHPHLPAARKLKSSTLLLTGVILTSEPRWRLALFRRSDNSSLNLPDVRTTFGLLCISFVGFSDDSSVTSLWHFSSVKVVFCRARIHVYCNHREERWAHVAVLPAHRITRMTRICRDCYLLYGMKMFINCQMKSRCRTLQTDSSRDAHLTPFKETKHWHMDHWNLYLLQGF